jgi:uncharacterized membrane protein YgcG
MRTAIFLLVALLSACTPNEAAPPPKLFKEQRNVLEQAKTIEAIQQEHAAEQREAIEQQAQ